MTRLLELRQPRVAGRTQRSRLAFDPGLLRSPARSTGRTPGDVHHRVSGVELRQRATAIAHSPRQLARAELWSDCGESHRLLVDPGVVGDGSAWNNRRIGSGRDRCRIEYFRGHTVQRSHGELAARVLRRWSG